VFEYLKLIFPLFIAVVGASLTFLYTQHLNRRSRAEQYQLEQIETIIKSLIANDFASSHSTDQEEIKQTRRDVRTALAMIPLFGDSTVLHFADPVLSTPRSPDGLVRAKGRDLNLLVRALQEQGRNIIQGKRRNGFFARSWRRWKRSRLRENGVLRRLRRLRRRHQRGRERDLRREENRLRTAQRTEP
jgi:hypothetical protein